MDLEQINTRMLFFHDFRGNNEAPANRLRWERSSLAETSNNAAHARCPYKNGFDEGILARQRDKAKELSPADFSSVIPRDVWGNRTNRNQSIRMLKSLQVLTQRKACPNVSEESRGFYGSHNKLGFLTSAHTIGTTPKPADPFWIGRRRRSCTLHL